MRWPAKHPGAWQPKFAWLPIEIDGQWLWLEWYLRRFCGDHYQVQHIY